MRGVADAQIEVALLAASFAIMDLMLPSAWAICLDIGGSDKICQPVGRRTKQGAFNLRQALCHR